MFLNLSLCVRGVDLEQYSDLLYLQKIAVEPYTTMKKRAHLSAVGSAKGTPGKNSHIYLGYVGGVCVSNPG